MLPKITPLVLMLTISLVGVHLQEYEGICNACMANRIACINEHFFAICFNGVPDLDNPIECPGSKVCTDTSARCEDPDFSNAVCTAVGSSTKRPECGSCKNAQDGDFVCMSNTTYSICKNGEPTPVLPFNCQNNKKCYTRLAAKRKPCVEECLDRADDICQTTPEDVPNETTSTPTTAITETNPITTPTTTLTTETTIPTTTTPETPTTTPETPTTTTTTTPETTTPTTAPTTTTTTPTTAPTTTAPTTTPTTAPTTTPTTTPTTAPTTAPTTTPTTTPTIIPTTETVLTTPTILPSDVDYAETVCANRTYPGRFPYANDCNKYVNCYKKSGQMLWTTLNCGTARYFDPATSLCTDTRPAGCP